METDHIKTITTAVESPPIKENGSKFIGFATPILSQEDFGAFLSGIKAGHPKASHFCYAYRIGNGDIYRVQDDGEPGGSAGLPIYNQILAAGITNVAVVVVRYFGGTKLGISGLIKAYKLCAKTVIGDAEIIRKVPEITIEILCGHQRQHAIFRLLNKRCAHLHTTVLDAGLHITATIKAGDRDLLEQLSTIPGTTVRSAH